MAFKWFKNKKKIKDGTPFENTELSPGIEEAMEADKASRLPEEAVFDLLAEDVSDVSDDDMVDAEGIPMEKTVISEPSVAAETTVPEPVAVSDPAKNVSEDDSEPPAIAPPIKEKKATGFFARLKKGLTKTRQILNTNIEGLFSSGRLVDDDMLEDLEEMLITSDIGVNTSMEIMARISKKAGKIKTAADLKETLKAEFLAMLPENPPADAAAETRPHVVMVVGVNGVGKTTTVGKLAAKLAGENKKGLVVAADTFRAAAVEQLTIWAQRAGAGIIRHKENADPAAVAFDGVAAAMARDIDTVYIDTAGRLHTKTNLMEELKKIKRSVDKKMPGAPHEILLVLDATTGQNAISQAKLFDEALDLTGIILTKIDGTAKGGIVLSICNTLAIPLKYMGVGESVEDLQVFDPNEFVNALL